MRVIMQIGFFPEYFLYLEYRLFSTEKEFFLKGLSYTPFTHKDASIARIRGLLPVNY